MSKSKKKTRQSSGFVPSCELPVADLPTLREVLGKVTLEKEKLTLDQMRCGRDVPIHEVLGKVMEAVKVIFKKTNSSLPIISDQRIFAIIREEHKQMMTLNRSKAETQKKFEKKLDSIFDLIFCKCQIVHCSEHNCPGCEYQAHCLCNCLREKKIPKLELMFVLDQRSRSGGEKGKYQIGGNDKKETARIDKSDKRKAKKAKGKKVKEVKKSEVVEEQSFETDLREDDEDLNGNEEEEDLAKETSSVDKIKSLRNLAKECDRWGVSHRAGAALASAILIDAGLITQENLGNIIDKSRLRRWIDKYRGERQEADQKLLEQRQPPAFYFDGKKDQTLCVEKDERGKQYNVVRVEEHISVSAEPGGKYVTHLTPEGGKGKQVGDALVDYLTDHKVVDSWQVMGGDSTAANTGVDKGAFACIEEKLDRRLLRVVCTLHLNELPLRHVFCDIDGPTNSDHTFKGPIGKLLPDVEELDWNERFDKVTAGPGLPELSKAVVDDLSTDQHILWLLFQSLRSGTIRAELYSLTPGPICMSRWLTLCCRIVLLKMKKHGLKGKNKKNLDNIVHFLMVMYIPMWFTLKQKPGIKYGPQHLFKQIQLTKLLKEPVLSIVKHNMSINSYWAQSEILLLSMLADPTKSVRQRAVKQVLQLRGDHDKGDNSPRKFLKPQLKFEAVTYPDMIDWKLEKIYEPVLTTNLTRAEIKCIVNTPLVVPSYPAHTQSVERLVKQTSRASASVAGYNSRDGLLRSSETSRELLPKFESKQDFENNFA